MAGFETIVRPVVFPNIRPTPKQGVRPQESSTGDADKGLCIIRGSSGKIVQLPYSYSASSSSSNNVEYKRRYDEVRVYQEKDDGTVNRENFVDLEVANKIWKRGSKRPGVDQMSPAEKAQRDRDAKLYDQWTEIFRRAEEKKNIEIRKRNQIKENEDSSVGQGIGA